MDIDELIPGKVDETDGSVTFAERASADSYGVVDEIAGRVDHVGGPGSGCAQGRHSKRPIARSNLAVSHVDGAQAFANPPTFVA